MTTSGHTFPVYTDIPSRLSPRSWQLIRVGTVAAALALAVTLAVRPTAGLLVLWGLVVPVLPLVFLVAPGVWRNVCPLAATNQTPRVLRFTRGLKPPRWLTEYGYLVAVALLLVLIPGRKALFNHSGPASAALVLGALAAAFLGGVLVRGKAGWCSSICPMLPVQRLYGQTPFALVGNSHCRPCVGCTKNCYDFNPRVAYLADQYDDDRNFTLRRRLFAGAFPGVVTAFFVLPDPPEISVAALYGLFAVAALLSAGAFFAADAILRVPRAVLTAVFGALALVLYYWWVSPVFLENIRMDAPAVTWAARAGVILLAGTWLVRTTRTEARFVARSVTAPAKVGAPASLAKHVAAGRGQPEVLFLPGETRVVADPDTTILELAERSDLAIEAGCRMGMCGSDPVIVVDGMEHLSPVTEEEASTLQRLGLGEDARMACCARVRDAVTVSLDLTAASAPPVIAAPTIAADADVRRVVVLGNGIAGVTAADHVRRNHPDCSIDIVSREPHHLYNRMAISRLIYGRSAMQGLHLLPDAWYDEHRISCWLNTQATSLDRDEQTVTLGTGDVIEYDRLILAVGSRSFVPDLPGFGTAGCFVLREAADAMAIRAYAQGSGSQHAVVAGGGLLGLECAYALSKLALRVVVVEQAPWVMYRQLDAQAGAFLQEYLRELGVEAHAGAQIARLEGAGGVGAVELADGTRVPCDLFVMCAGIVPNAELARDAGLVVNRGVVVDDRLRTSDPHIFAAGDVAEFAGQVSGLWPAAVKQAEVAAVNAVGGDEAYVPQPPVTMLKIVGVDLASLGRFAPADGDTTVVLEDRATHRYRKLVIDPDGRVAGAILLGYGKDATLVSALMQHGVDVRACIEDLRRGDWQLLEGLVGAAVRDASNRALTATGRDI